MKRTDFYFENFTDGWKIWSLAVIPTLGIERNGSHFGIYILWLTMCFGVNLNIGKRS